MCELGKEQEVVEGTKKIEEVIGAWIVYGIYDVILKVVAADITMLGEIINKRIRQIPNIRATLTFPVAWS